MRRQLDESWGLVEATDDKAVDADEWGMTPEALAANEAAMRVADSL